MRINFWTVETYNLDCQMYLNKVKRCMNCHKCAYRVRLIWNTIFWSTPFSEIPKSMGYACFEIGCGHIEPD